jgi:hypothetical protein
MEPFLEVLIGRRPAGSWGVVLYLKKGKKNAAPQEKPKT